ncbi:SCO family protein [Sulfitobacter sabulilitoris]|nr:SCO family protein [Sulfitobacter sabulilitoris]
MLRPIAAGLLACASVAQADSPRPATLPFALGGAYSLTDQHGAHRSQADPQNHAQLLFFGYANCPGICSAAMPLMADVTDALAARDMAVTPVMITIDPARDTVDTMAAPLADLHPAFVGLTGDTAALQAAWRAFSVEHNLAYVDPEHGPVYSHGSLIYLLDGAGVVQTIIPPVLDAAAAAQIVLTYTAPNG